MRVHFRAQCGPGAAVQGDSVTDGGEMAAALRAVGDADRLAGRGGWIERSGEPVAASQWKKSVRSEPNLNFTTISWLYKFRTLKWSKIFSLKNATNSIRSFVQPIDIKDHL